MVRPARRLNVLAILSLVTDGEGRLLSGETIEDAARELLPLAPDALGINCVPAARLAADLGRLAAAAPGVPLAAYGNLGLPGDEKGWAFTEELSPEEYAEHAGRWLALGARIVGGCCGTRAEHTRGLRKRLDAHARETAGSEPAA